ncbi:sensor histidine kinase [Dyella kyungheensis]|jgi:signal transduction histidine kinase|uniref:histidine kinase n=1 Tax=Dyella kyungheensis TaxID=1242174 RepID=A0ABS2JW94_9GAMM|nr:HAMP domain-containing sensor histidine kinase [Dyella kyungheensis]MBM7122590.1 HAMP domain-containing histidine kinase [Dyella kyungheensis]
MEPRAHLLPRLFIDVVLPSTIAALALILALCLQQTHSLAERADATASLRLARLAGELGSTEGVSPQAALDRTLQEGKADQVLRVELHGSDGRLWSSGAAPTDTGATYRNEVRPQGTMSSWVSMEVDTHSLRKAQAMVWLLGALCATGILVLAWLARVSIRHRVLEPLSQVRYAVHELVNARHPQIDETPVSSEFLELRKTLQRLSELHEAQRRDWSTMQHDNAVEALDRLRQSQAATRSKSQFIALVSHHFRQPLQALELFAAGLDQNASEEQQSLFRQMRHSIASMTRLLDALLEISRLDAGVIAVKPIGFTAAELFMRDRTSLNHEAVQQHVTLAWRGSHHQLHGDADVAASLLYQLASNAIANAPEGRVLIAARRRGQAIRIEVRDNGPGIAVIHQQRIFEEFVQLQASESERRGGYGLGLAIAERLARLLGTRIGLRSEPGRGSTFWFDLPRMPQMERHSSSSAQKPAAPAWRQAS